MTEVLSHASPVRRVISIKFRSISPFFLIYRADYLDLSHDEFFNENDSSKFVYEPVAIAIKNFQIYGLKLFMDEFPHERRTRLREAEEQHFVNQNTSNTGLKFENVSEGGLNRETSSFVQQIQILGSHGKQSIKVKVKHNATLPGPKVWFYFINLSHLLSKFQK